MMSSQAKKLLLKILVSALLLAYLFYLADADVFMDRIGQLSVGFVLLAWVYYAACQLISAWRWQIFLAVKNIHVPLHKLFSFYMVGMFMNNFMPGAVGGDIVKTYDLYRYTRQGSLAVVSVFLERFTGLIALALIAVFAVIVSYRGIQSPLVLWSVGGTAGFLAAVVLFIWYPPLAGLVLRIARGLLPGAFHEKLGQLHQALHSYNEHKGALTLAIAISVVVQVLFAFYYALTARALGIDIDVFYFILFLPAITLVTMVPISLGGLGVREVLMVSLFAEAGIAAADVLSLSLTVHVINVLLSLWGGMILVFRKPVVSGAA